MKRILFAASAIAVLSCGVVQAQNGAPYPNRPIRLVVPYPAGGNVDSFARMMARNMEGDLGQQMVVDNRGGANGILGFDIVAKAVPDGYTIAATSFAFALNPSIYKSLPFDTARDFRPITNYVNGLGYLMVVHPSVQAKSVKEFIALAKRETLRYGSAGIGNGQHLAGELFAVKAGIKMEHIPYKGGGPVMTAVLGGEVHMNFPAAVVALPHVKSGRLRALAFTGEKRLASLPDVPTVSEDGLPGFTYDTGWHAFFAPAKTPDAILNRIHASVQKALQVPQVKEFFVSGGYETAGDTPAQFSKLFLSDIKRYGEIVRVAKIEPQ